MQGEEYGPAAATNMNTYKCMKAGVTNCTETGESGPMNNVKAQERVVSSFTFSIS
jgi:hypothetical protein